MEDAFDIAGGWEMKSSLVPLVQLPRQGGCCTKVVDQTIDGGGHLVQHLRVRQENAVGHVAGVGIPEECLEQAHVAVDPQKSELCAMLDRRLRAPGPWQSRWPSLLVLGGRSGGTGMTCVLACLLDR